MASWPSTWRNLALQAASIPVNSDTLAILKAWKDSTPLQPYSNNPLGMPAGTSGAPKYLNTRYALFPSMATFYRVFAAWVNSHDGKNLVHAMTSETPYPATWRVISALKWPGSDTETDYPSALLDLTEQSYRDSVNAADATQRKTSGIVGKPSELAQGMVAQARSLHQAAQTFSDATKATQYLLRRHATNGK